MEAGFKLLPTGSANLPSANELQGTVWRNLSLSERRRPSTTEPFRTLRDTSCLSTAADISPAMAEKARERLGEARNVSVLLEDAQALSFSDETFDAVVCNLGLMFFPEPARG